MKKSVLLNLILLGASAGGFAATNDISSATNRVTLTPQYINLLAEEMRAAHPALRAAYARTNAAAANVRSVKIWDDPMVSVGGMISERSMRAEDGDLIYGAEQKLPVFGKTQAERRMAQAESEVQQSAATSRFQLLRRDFAKALFQTALAERTAEITREDLGWLDTMLQSAERRYETGEAAQFDVLRLQNERSQRLTRLATELQRLEHERVNLNRFLNRDLRSPWPTLRLPGVAKPILYSQRLVNLAVKYEPELLVMRNEIKSAEASVEAARRQRYPDVGLGAESRNYTGSGEFRQAMITLSMSLPWGNRSRYSAAIQREQEKVKAAQQDAADFELGLRNEVHDLTVKIDAARREVLLYRDEIIARSETALESARGAWESGRGTFRDVLDARRMLLDAQLMHARAVTEQYQMMSDLVLCCGLGDFEALEMLGALPDNQSEKKNEN